jgi:hypothetical protein
MSSSSVKKARKRSPARTDGERVCRGKRVGRSTDRGAEFPLADPAVQFDEKAADELQEFVQIAEQCRDLRYTR